MSFADFDAAVAQTIASLNALGVTVTKTVSAVSQMKSIVVNAGAAVTSITDAAIAGHKHLEQLAASSVGGYLDRIQQLFAKLDEAKARYDAVAQVDIELALAELGNMLKLFDPEFDLSQFKSLSDSAKRKLNAPAPSAKKTAPGGTPVPGQVLTPMLPKSGSSQHTLDILVSTGQLSGHG